MTQARSFAIVFFNNIKKRLKKMWNDLFLDENNINEKSVVGFASFGMMCIFAVVDIVCGTLNVPFSINESIYNSFLILVLGSFGISGLEKMFGKASKSSDTDKKPKPEDFE